MASGPREADADDDDDDNVRSLSSSAETRALLLRATAKTYVYERARTPTRVRNDRERITREADRDRAIARSTVTRAYIGPEVLPAPRPPGGHLVLLSVYRDRVTAKPNPRFRIPSLALSGEALSDSPSFACLTGQPAGWDQSLWITCPGLPSGPDLRSYDSRKIASTRARGIKLREIPRRDGSER